ncbi:uncharacterized protein LOC115876184 [Sitophilus oryzae]|uniref:Uncharacterized protein LOC115876184 n=1 Tax=Sitophilus oryzae TaxID=7048 RepID=A0A6J2X9V7_SITOR|nr:uncharacterized protein LOC115876184 [Sitophilus oryzae]
MAKSKFLVPLLDVLLGKYFGEEITVLDSSTYTVPLPVTKVSRYELKVKIFKRVSRQEEKLDLFIKLFEPDVKIHIRLDLLTRFKKEVDTYNLTIPALTEFQRLNGFPEDQLYSNMFAKCIGARVSVEDDKSIPDKTAVIILENLKSLGYASENIVYGGFDLEAARLLVHNLAQFHAVPLAMRIMHLDVFQEKVVPSMAEFKKHTKNPEYYKIIDSIIKQGIEGDNELEPHLDAIFNAIEFSKANTWFTKYYTDETWITLSHSDYSILNLMLIKDDKGHALSSKIVDLQVFEYLHCTSDLLYFLFTSVEQEVLKKNYEALVKIYFERFLEVLTQCQVYTGEYTLKNFYQELTSEAPKVLINILQALPFVTCEKWPEDGEPVLTPKYKRKVRDTLLFMIRKGWIE